MRIGTRGSALALWQARTVARLIRETGGPECEIVVIRTSGDEKPTDPAAVPTEGAGFSPAGASAEGAGLSPAGASAEGVGLSPAGAPTEGAGFSPAGVSVAGVAFGPAGPQNVKRMFVKEIEDALLNGRIDMAVHSAKDLPGQLPDGLIIVATLEREDPRDALLLPGTSVNSFDAARAALGRTPRLGTSSVRRAAVLRGVFPGATFVPIRGNVDTRLRKLDAGDCDALVLAAAGVKRLGLEQRLSALIPTDICMPAPGQGIVAIEIAEGANAAVRDAIRRISDADAETALLAERAVVQALGGGCQVPLGALTTIDGQDIAVEGVVASADGATVLRAVARGHRGGAAAIGEKLAALLIAKGAGKFLR